MTAIFLNTLPFFAVLACGYAAARLRFFNEAATAYLTRFVFYFALSAMIFRFAATLPLASVFDPAAVLAYLSATLAVYLLVLSIARGRGTGLEVASIEAQSAAIGNVGFLGIPLLVGLTGVQAVGPLMMVLATDLIIFGSLIVILISARRDGRLSIGVLKPITVGLVKNPMVMSILTGLTWAMTGAPLATPVDDFLVLMGAAATPGALFAIGASLASKSTERLGIALWLSLAKLALHPMAVAVTTLLVFDVDRFTAGVMIAAAAMPTAGNVFMLAQHYGIAPTRASSTILVSTLISVLSLTLVIAMVLP